MGKLSSSEAELKKSIAYKKSVYTKTKKQVPCDVAFPFSFRQVALTEINKLKLTQSNDSPITVDIYL